MNFIDLVGIIQLSLVVYALTYIIVDSVIAEEPRNWIYKQFLRIRAGYVQNKLTDLLGCRYCTGFWITLGLGLGVTDLSVLSISASYGLSCVFLDAFADHGH